jgi:CheY-like chemotaxis protein
MKILIADDDRLTRRLLEVMLGEWGYEVVVAADGVEAWEVLQGKDPPRLALIDWLMPKMDGLELCRKLRGLPATQPTYVLLLTIKDGRGDAVAGLLAGADDYITKPYDADELQARLNAGVRMVNLQRTLTNQVRELEKALSEVKQLHGLLPICCYCKSIRDDQDYWQEVEAYIEKYANVHFTHGICPNCYAEKVVPDLQRLQAEGGGRRLFEEP